MKRLMLCGAMMVATVSMPAEARKLQMSFTPHQGQTLRMDAGLHAINSELPSSSARILQPDGDVRKRGSFSLAVFNAGPAPFNIGPENVTITFADGTPGIVIGYDRLVKEEKNRQMWMAIATGLGAAANSMSAAYAGNTSGTVNYSGTTTGRYGSTTTHGTASYSGYDAGAAQAAIANADAENHQRFAALAANGQAALEALKQNLRTTTVDPGGTAGGAIMFEVPKALRGSKTPLEMVIHVATGAETHDFAVTLASDK
jgi:hypothetical protein